jgi:hypothetical protein
LPGQTKGERAIWFSCSLQIKEAVAEVLPNWDDILKAAHEANAKACGNCGHRGDIFDLPPLGDHLHCNHPVLEIRDSPPHNAGWGTLREARETCEHWIPRQNASGEPTQGRAEPG